MTRTIILVLGILTLSGIARAQEASTLVGRWGFVSFFKEEDKGKAVGWARAACGQPYIINRGKQGGVMMHSPDATAPSELLLSGNRLVPASGEANGSRSIEFIDANTFVTRYDDDFALKRYGAQIYARCGGKK